jgi:hypothetical protein
MRMKVPIALPMEPARGPRPIGGRAMAIVHDELRCRPQGRRSDDGRCPKGVVPRQSALRVQRREYGCDRERAPSDPSKDIVDAVAYLAGPDSDCANGQIIRISGGAVSSSLLQQSEYC